MFEGILVRTVDIETVSSLADSFRRNSGGGAKRNRQRKAVALQLLDALAAAFAYEASFICSTLAALRERVPRLARKLDAVLARLEEVTAPGFVFYPSLPLYLAPADADSDEEDIPVPVAIEISDESGEDIVPAAKERPKAKARPRSRTPPPPPAPLPRLATFRLHIWAEFDRFVDQVHSSLVALSLFSIVALDHHQAADKDREVTITALNQIARAQQWLPIILSFAVQPWRIRDTLAFYTSLPHPCRPLIVAHTIERTDQFGKGFALRLLYDRLASRGIPLARVVLIDDKDYIARDTSTQGNPAIEGIHWPVRSRLSLTAALQQSGALE